jgi:hypothetical protein
MLKLDAVNICIRALGDPAVTALDTNGQSDAGEAEAEIDRQLKIVLRHGGWGTAANIREEVLFELPTQTITASGGSGTFTYGETITQSGSGATGAFKYEEGGKVYVTTATGSAAWNGSGALANVGSTVTRGTVTATAAITSAKHAVPETAFYAFRPSKREWRPLTVYNGFLYDVNQDTQTFTGNVYLDVMSVRTWTETPDIIQEYVARKAARQFQRFKKRGVTDDQMLAADELEAKIAFMRWDNAMKQTHVLQNSHGLSAWVPVMP